METILESMTQLIHFCSQDNSKYWKIQVIAKFEKCARLLALIYNPMINFYVTSDRIESLLYEENEKYKIELRQGYNIFDLLTDLSSRRITGDTAIAHCVSFIEQNGLYEATILKILDKDLSCGISVKTINEAFPNLISEFLVPLGKDYEEGMCDFKEDDWYASRKLDGVRCLAFVFKDEVRFYSRHGKEFFTLDKLSEDILNNYPVNNIQLGGQILDGEICVVDENGNEDFESIMKLIRRKNYTIESPKFFVFDKYSTQEFDDTETETVFTKRYDELANNVKDCKFIELVDQTLIYSKKELSLLIESIPSEWEGLMLRKNCTTKFKRSNELLKVKPFYDDEYVVVDTVVGTKVIDGIQQDCCGNIVIEHSGFKQRVGSGLTDSQRISWYKHPSLIVGKTVTVRYFSEIEDENGEISLRFPSLKCVYQKL